MKIQVIHLKRSNHLVEHSDQVFNLSRSSEVPLFRALSNDYTHLPLDRTRAKTQVKTVEEAVRMYEQDLKMRVINGSKQKRLALRHLYDSCVLLNLQNKTIYFGCYCKCEINPKKYDHVCHCDILKKIILNKYNKSLKDGKKETVNEQNL